MSSDPQSLFRQEVLAAKSDTLSGQALNIRPVSADRLTLFFAGLATIVLNMTVVRQLAGLSLTAQLRSTERSLVSAVVAGAVVWAAQTPSGAGWSWLHLAGELAAVSTLGVAVYGAMHLVLWSLASRPPGPETELLSLLDKLRHKFLPHQVSTHDQ